MKKMKRPPVKPKILNTRGQILEKIAKKRLEGLTNDLVAQANGELQGPPARFEYPGTELKFSDHPAVSLEEHIAAIDKAVREAVPNAISRRAQKTAKSPRPKNRVIGDGQMKAIVARLRKNRQIKDHNLAAAIQRELQKDGEAPALPTIRGHLRRLGLIVKK